MDLKKQDLALHYGSRERSERPMRASLDAIPSNMEGSFRRGSVSPSKRAGIEGITPTIDQKKRLPSIFQKYLNLHPVQEDVVTQQKVFEQNQYPTKARAAVLD